MTTEDTPVSERKWTKGPWVAEVVEGNSGGWRAMEQSIVIRSGETFIASYVTSYCEYPEKNDESAANALIMAASPDLYEALSDLIAAYEDPGNEGHTHDDKVAKARAALQRAEGEV